MTMRAPFSKLTPARSLTIAGLAILPLVGSAWLAMGQLEPMKSPSATVSPPAVSRPSYLVAVRAPTPEEAEQRRALAAVEPRTLLPSAPLAISSPSVETLETRGAAASNTARLVSDVNLRSAPGTDSAVLRIATGGARVSILESRNGWSKARLESGDEGWIASRFLAND